MPTSPDISLPLLPGQTYHIYNRGNEKRLIFFQEENFSYFLKRYQDYGKGFLDTYAYCLLDNHFHLCVRVKSGDEIISAARADEDFKLDSHFVRRYVMPYLESMDAANLKAADHGAADLTDLEDLLNLMPHLMPPTKPPHKIDRKPPSLSTTLSEYDSHPERLNELPFETQLCSYIVSQRMRRFLLSYAKSINKQQERTGSLFQKAFRRKWIPSDDDLKSVITYIHHNVIHHGYDESYERYPWSSYREYISNKENSIICNEGLSLFGSKTEFVEFSADFKTKKTDEMEFD